MKTKIIKIGNSRGIRIPKSFLDESKLSEEVDIRLDSGRIIIEPAAIPVDDSIIMSHSALLDWDSAEEDEAWAHLQ